MGLDILIGANNQATLDAGEYEPAHHQLSRTFGYLMGRRHEIVGLPELDQIGHLTGVDISPLYVMDDYLLPDDEQSLLESAEDEAELLAMEERFRVAAAARAGNIDQVTIIVQDLLQKVALLPDLPTQLLPVLPDTLHRASYFAHFAASTHDGYENTFGQDLRNFKRFLDYAKSKGSETIFFVYG
jgi:hypothetical protein